MLLDVQVQYLVRWVVEPTVNTRTEGIDKALLQLQTGIQQDLQFRSENLIAEVNPPDAEPMQVDSEVPPQHAASTIAATAIDLSLIHI